MAKSRSKAALEEGVKQPIEPEVLDAADPGVGSEYLVAKPVCAADLIYLLEKEFYCTKAEVGRFLGITAKQVEDQMRNDPTWAQAWRKGRDEFDTEGVKKRFSQLARGYDWEEVTKERIKTWDKETKSYLYGDDLEVTKTVTKHVPPHPVAGIFWLKNKLKDEFVDKVENETTLKAKYEVTLVSKVPEPEALPPGV